MIHFIKRPDDVTTMVMKYIVEMSFWISSELELRKKSNWIYIKNSELNSINDVRPRDDHSGHAWHTGNYAVPSINWLVKLVDCDISYTDYF